jgi:hypothetical protein
MTTLHTPTPAFTLQINNHPQTPLIRQPTNLPCQLMGVNAASQTDFRFSFRGFARRGGATDIHSHGWGMAFYDGRGLRAFHDCEPASESLLAEFLTSHPIKVRCFFVGACELSCSLMCDLLCVYLNSYSCS